MRLTGLDPRWVGDYAAPADARQGVSFSCPHCQRLRLAIFFDVPISAHPAVDLALVHSQAIDDGEQPGHLADHHIGRILWHREGESFETLTLQPSVDASHFGHWHGFITNGDVT